MPFIRHKEVFLKLTSHGQKSRGPLVALVFEMPEYGFPIGRACAHQRLDTNVFFLASPVSKVRNNLRFGDWRPVGIVLASCLRPVCVLSGSYLS
jgi:hypothetical protein